VSDAVSVSDIARRCNVRSNVVSNWIARHADFPAPVTTISDRFRAWEWADVRDWLDEKGKP